MKEVNEQDSEKVDFVSVMTHELKTSLTAIIASAELLADELQLSDQSPHGKLIQSIIRNAHQLDERVSSFSEMPRAHMKDFQFKPEPCDIEQIIRSVATRLHPQVQSRRQSFTLRLPDFLPLVKADKYHLEQILLTLISNASKYTPEEGEIEVSAWQHTNDSLVVQVSDTCGGIPTEERELVFQPHYQINRSEGKGGLGLAIAKFLVELHGGKIWLESKMGEGCSFLFSISIAE